MAVPITVKIPEPITAPIPSEVRLNHPSDFLSRFSGISESEMSLSMLLVRKSCGSNRHLPPCDRQKTLPCPDLGRNLRLAVITASARAAGERAAPAQRQNAAGARVAT